jgi:hypothetical protein
VTGGPIGAPLARHTLFVRWVGFSPDGKLVATASDDGRSGSGTCPMVHRAASRSSVTPICADRFEEFVQRFWLDNLAWYALCTGVELSGAVRDYITAIRG